MSRKKVKLGNLGLTARQIERLSDIRDTVFLDFDTVDADIFVHVSRDVTDQELDALKSACAVLSDAPLPREVEKTDFKQHPLYRATPAQARAWIQNNVNDLPTAKAVLGDLAAAVALLLRRSHLN